MLIYTCPACEAGNHECCYGTRNPPPGVFGGSKCDCPCGLEKPLAVKKTYHIEQSGDVYFLVADDGSERLEAGHSRAVAEFALASLNSGVGQVDPSKDLNPFKHGRWTN